MSETQQPGPSVYNHRLASDLMAHADVAARRGDDQAAATLWRQAGDREAAALSTIPVSRPRTRGLIAVSAVACYVAAGEQVQAYKLANKYLAMGDLPEFASKQIRGMVEGMNT